MSPKLAWLLLVAGFSPIDLLFSGFAIYFGYKHSFRRLTAEEIASAPG